jgi:hypothetical protein
MSQMLQGKFQISTVSTAKYGVILPCSYKLETAVILIHILRLELSPNAQGFEGNSQQPEINGYG